MENTKEFIEGQDYDITEVTVTMEGIVKGIQQWYEIIKKALKQEELQQLFSSHTGSRLIGKMKNR